MYKLLLAWRYLRTRFIALASVVSVTLGVATLIVVNSVMSGFVEEMHSRLHGILSDIEMAAPLFATIQDPDAKIAQIQELVGDDIEAITKIARVPALLQFEFNGQPMTHQIMLVGIDEESFSKVSEFQPFLLNELNRQERISFELREKGYDPSLELSGWDYRREKIRFYRELTGWDPSQQPARPAADTDANFVLSGDDLDFNRIPRPEDFQQDVAESNAAAEKTQPPHYQDEFIDQRAGTDLVFDPYNDTYTGVVLGLAISNRKVIDASTNETRDLFLLRPGDDVQINLPTSGSSPSFITENLTIVDFYSSKMHEFDSNFAFMPLRKMQQIRGMIDPSTGIGEVSSIQIKLKPGADLNAVRDKISAYFPPTRYNLVVQTWQDQQRPLLSAVNLELTILNILLFLIIAVAGFGILATFYMIVVEKTKDIGILKSLGAPSRGVASIFLGYGLSLGTVGTLVGIVLGLLFVVYINDIADLIMFVTGREVFDPTIYYFEKIPTVISPLSVLWVAAGAIGIAVIAAVLPSIRAARLHPVEALRYE